MFSESKPMTTSVMAYHETVDRYIEKFRNTGSNLLKGIMQDEMDRLESEMH